MPRAERLPPRRRPQRFPRGCRVGRPVPGVATRPADGFRTVRFPAMLRTGRNEIVVQLTSYFNVNFNWAGFAFDITEPSS